MFLWLVALFGIDDLAFRKDGWIPIEVQGNDPIGEVFMNEQISEIVFYNFDLELEVLILRVSQDIVEEASEGNNELTNEATN